MITHKNFILASSSSSRFKILKNSGFVFKKTNPECNEEEIKKNFLNRRPAFIAKKLSFEKAKSVSIKKKYHKDYVIGCDTLIYLNNKIFNKAKNMREAETKIQKLSGKTHKIISGLTICREGKMLWQCSSTSLVKIRKLTNLEIKKYLYTAGPQILSSVGCYQIESHGPKIIQDIKGDFFNVMGLPLFSLLKYVFEEK